MTDSSTGASREALFCIGSNCGDRDVNVKAALVWLSGILADLRHSPVYTTPDCHGGPRKYMNAVAVGETDLDPMELDRMCKEYELSAGRDSAALEAGDVPVDIDLVIFGGKVLRMKDYQSRFFIMGYEMINPEC